MKTSATPKIITRGMCIFCKDEFDKSKMSQHLRNCKARKAIFASLAADETRKKTCLFHIQVEGRYQPQYWMHLEMPIEATLDDLDDFLRTIWFEHFEHLSGFRIDDTSYSSEEGYDDSDLSFLGGIIVDSEESEQEEEEEEDEEEDFVNGEDLLAELPDEYIKLLTPDFIELLKQRWFIYDLLPIVKEKLKNVCKQTDDLFREPGHSREGLLNGHMLQSALKWIIAVIENTTTSVQLQYVLKVEKKFYYTYDYGTSTRLVLRVVSEREGVVRDEKEPVELLALNVAPEIPCVICGKPATQILANYYAEMEQTYCDECVKTRGNKDKEEDEGEGEEEDEGEGEYMYEREESFIQIVNSPRIGIID